MPLLDHFRPPLAGRRHWHSFHNTWASNISAMLNQRLPAGYFAEPNVQFGIEIDVAAFADDLPDQPPAADWTPPPPRSSTPVTMTEAVVEVGIFSTSGGPILVGAVELVSPGNKDRPAKREALVSKCAAYLQAGVGLVVVDVVTERPADVPAELVVRVGGAAGTTAGSPLYAAAYRPVERDGATVLDQWYEPVAVGDVLPTLPLWLKGGLCLPVELQAAYDRTCRDLKFTPAA